MKSTQAARNHERALAEFVQTIAEITKTTREISFEATDHLGVDPDAVNWAHVGDAKRILEGLREVLAVARHENR